MHVHELQRPCAYAGVRSSDCKRVTPHDRDIISDLTTSRRAVPEQRNELNPACARTQTRHKHRRSGLRYQTIKTSKLQSILTNEIRKDKKKRNAFWELDITTSD